MYNPWTTIYEYETTADHNPSSDESTVRTAAISLARQV